MKKIFKRLFCLHDWRDGLGLGWFIDGCPSVPEAGLVWGEGYYEHYHCVKCGKIISSTRIPLSYKG